MVRRCENPDCQVAGDLDAAVDSLAVAEARRGFRHVGAPIITILLSILAVWGSLLWLRTAHAVPEVAVPEVVETILLEENARPIAVAANPNNNYAYVVNIGTGTVSVINGTELLTTIDLKTVDRPATGCIGPTAYGRCLNAVGVNTVTDHVYVTEWYYDVAQIISGTQVIDWVYAGKGPAGVVPHPNNDSICVLDKWTPGVTVIQGDQDRVFISGSEPNAGAVDPRTGYVYIANSGSNSVAVISNLTKIADIPVGSYPNAVTYSPSNGYIYVVNSGSNPATVSVISGTQVITGPIPVGTSNTNLGVHGFWGIERDGSTHIIGAHPTGYVYVANWVSNTVSIISNTQWITDIVVGTNPNAVGVDPATCYVYVANTDSDSVSIISGTSVITTLTVGDYPFDLAVNPATGYVYVANRDDDSVSILHHGETPTPTPTPTPTVTPTATPTLTPRAWLPLVMKNWRCIEFSRYTWNVKTSETPVGPGPNYFSNRVEDVWVDENGRLHLRIVQRDGRWYCTEVFTEAPLGYGKYVFHIASRVDQLDKNIVLGLFTWDDTASEYSYREIDIEFAKWGQAANDNAQYVVQPWEHAGNMYRFDMELGGDDSTHGFDWHADHIFFQSLHGHQPFPGSEEDEIESWTYTGDDIPPAGGGNARINLWLFNGNPPSDGEAAEVIIEAFEFVPQTE